MTAGADRLRTLEELLMWCRAVRAELVEVIVQDEFTHDVIVREAAGTYLVFDST